MSSIYDDLPPVAPTMSRIWQAKIAVTVTTFDEPLFVIIPAFHPSLRWGPCPWNQRYYVQETDVSESGESEHIIEKFMYPLYPARGDDALVVYDNDRQLWVISWWPRNINPEGNRG